MSQYTEELKLLLSVTSVHTAMLFLVKKYGPEAYETEYNNVLNNLSMLNPNVPFERVPLFAQLLETILATTLDAKKWFDENNILDEMLDHFAALDLMREEVDQLLMSPLSPSLNLSLT